MTFTAYIERQKAIIRGRHAEEGLSVNKGEQFALNETERILCDLNSLKGLNVAERMSMQSRKV